MTPARIAELRQETVSMFYHGYDNYMKIAFPEDEVSRTDTLGEEDTTDCFPVTSYILPTSNSRLSKPAPYRIERCPGKLLPHLDR